METASVRCPYCAEWVEVVVEPDVCGEMVIDCEVCCRPWQVQVAWRRGRLALRVGRGDD